MIKKPSFKSQLREMKKANYSDLRNAVITDLLSQSKDDEDIIVYGKDTLNHGCNSGNVGMLIYYTDTCKFYKKHKSDIMTLVKQSLRDFGYRSMAEMFGTNWDEEDILIEDISNQNLLAWFAYEETLRNIFNELDIEY